MRIHVIQLVLAKKNVVGLHKFNQYPTICREANVLCHPVESQVWYNTRLAKRAEMSYHSCRFR